ncbi:hypothetical protein KI387_040662, partial [Taxus chinensis]
KHKGHLAAQQDNESDEETSEGAHSGKNLVLVSQTSHPTKRVWLIDSGASKHMSGDKELFDSLDEQPTGDRVQIADDKEYVAEGIGRVTIPLGP